MGLTAKVKPANPSDAAPVSALNPFRIPVYDNVLAILLAGGAGERLYPLTRDTAKPGVPFGGVYRIIDFTLSNCMNSDVRRIFILTQYKSLELNRHIRDGWHIFSSELGEFIEILPPMKRVSDEWYQGTADAVYQNLQSILTEAPEQVLILSGDHIYKMNYQDMIAWHRIEERRHHDRHHSGSARKRRHRFGVAQIDAGSRHQRIRRKAAARQSGPVGLRSLDGQRLDGDLCFQPEGADRRTARRCRGSGFFTRFRQGCAAEMPCTAGA